MADIPTPPLDEFLSRYQEDDNEWWTLSSGDHQNLFDAAVERAEVAEARLRIVEEDLARSKDAHGRDVVRAVRAEAAVAHYENTITWNTTCHGCAAALDASYSETVRAEKAEAKLARVRALANLPERPEDYDEAVTSYQATVGSTWEEASWHAAMSLARDAVGEEHAGDEAGEPGEGPA